MQAVWEVPRLESVLRGFTPRLGNTVVSYIFLLILSPFLWFRTRFPQIHLAVQRQSTAAPASVHGPNSLCVYMLIRRKDLNCYLTTHHSFYFQIPRSIQSGLATCHGSYCIMWAFVKCTFRRLFRGSERLDMSIMFGNYIQGRIFLYKFNAKSFRTVKEISSQQELLQERIANSTNRGQEEISVEQTKKLISTKNVNKDQFGYKIDVVTNVGRYDQPRKFLLPVSGNYTIECNKRY